MVDRVIDTFVELGAEKAALPRCPGFEEMYWKGKVVEADVLVSGLRKHFKTPWPEIAPLRIEHLIENMDAANIKYLSFTA